MLSAVAFNALAVSAVQPNSRMTEPTCCEISIATAPSLLITLMGQSSTISCDRMLSGRHLTSSQIAKAQHVHSLTRAAQLYLALAMTRSVFSPPGQQRRVTRIPVEKLMPTPASCIIARACTTRLRGDSVRRIRLGFVRLSYGGIFPAAYFGDAHFALPLLSSSLPYRDHQPLRLVIFSLRPELPRCRRNVSDARRLPQV